MHMRESAAAVAKFGFDGEPLFVQIEHHGDGPYVGVKLDNCGQFRNLTWWAELLNATGRW